MKKAYSISDNTKMCEFLISELRRGNEDAKFPRGNKIWIKAAERNVFKNRSYQSLRDHARRYILPNLDSVSLSKRDIKFMKKCFKTVTEISMEDENESNDDSRPKDNELVNKDGSAKELTKKSLCDAQTQTSLVETIHAASQTLQSSESELPCELNETITLNNMFSDGNPDENNIKVKSTTEVASTEAVCDASSFNEDFSILSKRFDELDNIVTEQSNKLTIIMDLFRVSRGGATVTDGSYPIVAEDEANNNVPIGFPNQIITCEENRLLLENNSSAKQQIMKSTCKEIFDRWFSILSNRFDEQNNKLIEQNKILSYVVDLLQKEIVISTNEVLSVETTPSPPPIIVTQPVFKTFVKNVLCDESCEEEEDVKPPVVISLGTPYVKLTRLDLDRFKSKLSEMNQSNTVQFERDDVDSDSQNNNNATIPLQTITSSCRRFYKYRLDMKKNLQIGGVKFSKNNFFLKTSRKGQKRKDSFITRQKSVHRKVSNAKYLSNFAALLNANGKKNPLMTWICSVCSKMYSSQQWFKLHLRKHHNWATLY